MWTSITESIKNDLGEDNFSLWVKPIEPEKLENNVLYLKVPNRFFSDWLKENLQTKIQERLKQLTNQSIELSYEIGRSADTTLSQASPAADGGSDNSVDSGLNPRYSFETFVVGPSNRFAHATAEAIVKNPGRQFNPFVIYGGVGLGKTHLMCALGHALIKNNPRTRVFYATSEGFVNEFIDSIRYDRTNAFRNKYRKLDCLLIDDIQFLIGKGRSEEEFFYTFNALFDSQKQIILTSDRAPKEMSPLERRLISRLEWGVVADIKPPELETRIAILRKKAEAEKLYMPDDVILYIADRIKSNIRELEGSLIRVGAYASATASPLSVDVAKEVLKDAHGESDAEASINIKTIQKVVARKYHLQVADLKSKIRSDNIALPRQIAMYLARQLTSMSTTDIGTSFGGRDHTTVLHSLNKIKGKMENDIYFVQMINQLMEEVKKEENP
ncbi:MAG: hypothetical protein A3G41_06070 [Elusimicrobia bacterium RIFCSPLOWO2_12_FULL_59_9]|nr:MAG: hypothetical protein A3G41_06070 [Elusimicrobia bacterium RIFCSPLOWO2_12_FULL_59_9]